MIVLGTDTQGKVWLVGNGRGSVPSLWNNLTLTIYELTADQESTFNALPAARSGTMFDGKAFVALSPAPTPPAVISLEEKVAALQAAIGLTDSQIIAATAAVSVAL